MGRISLNELHEQIIQGLTEKDFLKKINISEEKIQSMLLNSNFISKLFVIINKTNITCEDIKELSYDLLCSVCNDLPNEFTEYAYNYILNKTFPNLINMEFNIKYENAVLLYVKILKIIMIYIEGLDKEENFNINDCINDKALIDAKDEEYNIFLNIYNNNYIYELLRLNYDLTHSDLLFTVYGICKLAYKISNELKSNSNININQGRLYAAVIGHLIADYFEINMDKQLIKPKKYFYDWFVKNKLFSIANISESSCIENLTSEHLGIEALIIIYCTCRINIKNSNKITYIKLEQYCKNKNIPNTIYRKIVDFERFLVSCNVNDIYCDINYINKDTALLFGNEIVDYIKNLAIKNNAITMSMLSDSKLFSQIIENVKSTNIREDIIVYLNVFDTYSLYLEENKKLKLIDTLFYLLKSKDSEIRTMSSELLGKIIAFFDEFQDINTFSPISIKTNYKLWNKYLDLFILSDDIGSKESLIFCFRDFVESFIKNISKDDINSYIRCLLNYFSKIENDEYKAQMFIYSLTCIEIGLFNKEHIEIIFNYVLNIINICGNELRLTLLNYIFNIIRNEKLSKSIVDNIIEKVDLINNNHSISESYLKYKILLILKQDDKILEQYKEFMMDKSKNISEIFLNNLKTATYWLEKIISIDFLLDAVNNISNKVVLLHTATHLCNLVKVTASEIVRNKAGKALLDIGSCLSMDQSNEISVELLKGLEISNHEFSRYIPKYLGKFILLLHPKELDEIIDEINRLCKESNPSISILSLKTLCVIIQFYSEYRTKFKEPISVYNDRLKKLLGILVSGLINKNEQIRGEALLLIGTELFDSDNISCENKYIIFKQISKKVLNLLNFNNNNEMFLLNCSVSFNCIYRFINSYCTDFEQISIPVNDKIAFFSNDFNPFSLENKKIVNNITGLGYEVYLFIDEFCWSKNLQPYKIRKEIINISISDLFDVYLFPDDISINLSNINDLKLLKKLFEGTSSTPSIVMNADELIHNEMYKMKISKNTIHNFEHIVYNNLTNKSFLDKYCETKNKLKGKIIELDVPTEYDTLYPHTKKNDINNSLSTTTLIDNNSMKFIQKKDLYLREPKNKAVIKRRNFNIEIINNLSANIVDEIGHYIFMYTNLYENIGEELMNKNISLLVIREINSSNRIIGFSAFHHISTSELFNEFKNSDIANYIRKNTSGKIIIIDGMYTNPSAVVNNLEQILLTETLTYCLKKDFTYALYYNTLLNYSSERIFNLLELHGFKKLEVGQNNKNIYAVDMKFPVCLTLDVENYIKEPFVNNEAVIDSIRYTRQNLQKLLTNLYPNNLVLSFDANMLQYALVEQICKGNSVSSNDSKTENIDNFICVPYGNILKGKCFPNIVTKSLHVEKSYDYEIKNYKIVENQFYPSISRQIDTIKSFGKRIILVDDILHYGHEILGLDSELKQKDIDIDKVVVSILSSNGKDMMNMLDRKVECVYFLPNLRLWLKESILYPFIGGYTVDSDKYKLDANLIPSINYILPYMTPNFIDGVDKGIIYDLSMLCLNNTRVIFEVLEKEYEKVYDKKLTLERLSEVIKTPRFPSKGVNVCYNLEKSVSSYIENDIKNLIRIEQIIKY